MNAYLKRIYYNPSQPASFGNADDLYDKAKADNRDYKLTDIQEWLLQQETHTLFKPSKHNFKSPRVIVSDKHYQYDVDVCYMIKWTKENKGYGYFLVCIDIFTRWGRAVPLYTLTGKEMKETLAHLFKKQKPTVCRSDGGSEFVNATVQNYFKENNIKHVRTLNYLKKANYAERFLKTLKTRMTKYLYYKQSHVWLDILPKVIKAYNHHIHRSIRMSPLHALKTATKSELWHIQYGPQRVRGPRKTAPKLKKDIFKFKVGDVVRIVKVRRLFRRQYDEWNSHELFIIVHVQSKQSIALYTLKDWDNDEIKGLFHTEELVKVTVNSNTKYKIEQVLGKKKWLGTSGVCVRWFGWPAKYDSWLTEEEFEDLS